jgi:hypothetical protein
LEISPVADVSIDIRRLHYQPGGGMPKLFDERGWPETQAASACFDETDAMQCGADDY